MYNDSFPTFFKVAFVLVALVFIVSIGSCGVYSCQRGTVTITVTEKHRITTGSGKSIHSFWVVFGRDANGNPVELSNEDSLINLKFDSSRTQNILEIGKTYKVEAMGFRNYVMSMYPNIVRVIGEVNTEKKNNKKPLPDTNGDDNARRRRDDDADEQYSE